MLFGSFCMLVALAVAWLACEVRTLKMQQEKTMSALDNLKAAVTAQASVDASAVTLIQGIATQLKTVSSDANVQALADQLTAASTPLAAAVTANTPAAPAGGVTGSAAAGTVAGTGASVGTAS